MRRFELGMSLDYVSHWGVEDALRELFQNCLDASVSNPENEWYVDYSKESNTVRIGNKKGVLYTSSLLLGKTSKKDKENQIGKFGEGYKVGTVVLLRNGCSVKVYNYQKKEIWEAKLVKSRRYNDVVPVFDIQIDNPFNRIKGNDLIFEVGNVTQDVWERVIERNLFLQEDIGSVLDAKDEGRVLLDKRFAGCIYVSGLYVCKKDFVHYGYDLSPANVKLDRDRGLVDSYNLQFTLGKVLAYTNCSELIKESLRFFDGKYTMLYNSFGSAHGIVGDSIAREFVEKYGKDAVPCSTPEEFNYHNNLGEHAVMISDVEKSYILESSVYVPMVDQDIVFSNKESEDKLVTWYEFIGKSAILDKDKYKEGLKLINQVTTEIRELRGKCKGLEDKLDKVYSSLKSSDSGSTEQS